MTLAYNGNFPNYIYTPNPLPNMIRLFNGLATETRNSLLAQLSKPSAGTLQRVKRQAVSELRGSMGTTVRLKRKVNAHDPHSEKGPPARKTDPSRKFRT
jgi:hypothetical protein